MKKLALILAFAGAVFGQTPVCRSTFQLTTATQSAQFDNRQQGCVYWSVAYNVTGFSALSLTFQSSLGGSTPTAFTTYPGTTVTGSNPMTTATGTTSTFVGIAPAYVRVDLSGLTGSGVVTGVIVGYATDPSTVTAVVTLPDPLPVESEGVTVTPDDTLSNTAIPVDTSTAGAIFNRTLPFVYSNADNQWKRLRGDVNGMWINGIVAAGSIIPAGVNPIQLGMASASARARNLFAVDAIADTGSAPNILSAGVSIFGGGTAWPRVRSGSLTNFPVSSTLTARNSIGAVVETKDSRWVVNAISATAASATIASEASVRHVLDTVCWSGVSSGSVTAASHAINIRDGATGAGTLLATFLVAFPTAAASGVQVIPPFCISNLNLVGSTATAFTVEFDAGSTNVSTNVFMTGYNIN
jgi:hypothetical protein